MGVLDSLDSPTESLCEALFLHGCISIVLVFVFLFYQRYSEIYNPLDRREQLISKTNQASKQTSSPRYLTTTPSHTDIITTIKSLYFLPDEYFIIHSGMDSYIFLRFLKLCRNLTFICALVGCIILLPVYGTTPANNGVGGIRGTTLSIVQLEDPKSWAAWMLNCVFIVLCLYMFHVEYGNFRTCQRINLQNEDKFIHPQTNYTVMVHDVPRLCSTKKFKAMFEGMFPGKILFACKCVNINPLLVVIQQRNALIKELEWFNAMESIKTPPTSLLIHWITTGCVTQHDSLQTVRRIEQLHVTIQRLQTEAKQVENGLYSSSSDGSHRPIEIRHELVRIISSLSQRNSSTMREKLIGTEDEEVVARDSESIASSTSLSIVSSDVSSDGSQRLSESAHGLVKEDPDDLLRYKITSDRLISTGFITFSNRADYLAVCSIDILSEQYPNMKAYPIQSRSDIVWDNVGVTALQIHLSQATITFFYHGLLTILVFFMIVVGFLIGLDAVANYFGIDITPKAMGALMGIIPAGYFIALTYPIPHLMTFLATRVERLPSYLSIQKEVLAWYTYYLMCLGCAVLICGSLFIGIPGDYTDPDLNIFHITIPATSVFFMCLIITMGFTGSAVLLVRPMRLIRYLMLRYCIDPQLITVRMLTEGSLQPCTIEYGVILPPFLFILFVCQLFWAVSPLVTAFAFVYFNNYYYVWKYQALHMVQKTQEHSGELWFSIYRFAMLGLFVATFILTLLMAVINGVPAALFLFTFLVVIQTVRNHTEKVFGSPSGQQSSYSAAIDLDEKTAMGSNHGAKDPVVSSFSNDFIYQSELIKSVIKSPNPHRIQNAPLLNDQNELNDVYLQMASNGN